MQNIPRRTNIYLFAFSESRLFLRLACLVVAVPIGHFLLLVFTSLRPLSSPTPRTRWKVARLTYERFIWFLLLLAHYPRRSYAAFRACGVFALQAAMVRHPRLVLWRFFAATFLAGFPCPTALAIPCRFCRHGILYLLGSLCHSTSAAGRVSTAIANICSIGFSAVGKHVGARHGAAVLTRRPQTCVTAVGRRAVASHSPSIEVAEKGFASDTASHIRGETRVWNAFR